MRLQRPSRGHREVAIAITLGFALTLATPAHAQDADDFAPTNRSWNGLSTFTGLARGLGLEVSTVAGLDWSDLSAEDLLVLVSPDRRVDPQRLDAFVQAGGHVVIADDFGPSDEAMARLAVLRSDAEAISATRFYKDRAYAPIATPNAAHPVVDGVTEVVTNHPAVLIRYDGATSVLGFGEQSIVVVGERGSGKFAALSDPSILINRMLEFPGNLRLATNLLRWLDRKQRIRRMVLVQGDVSMFGEPRPYIDDARAGPVGQSIAGINQWLAQTSEWLLTPTAMRISAVLIAALLVALLLWAMPLRRTLAADGRWLRMHRSGRRDGADRMIADAESGREFLPAAALVRDRAQVVLARATGVADPLYAVSESQLIAAVRKAKGEAAAEALRHVYRRLRAVPSRSQAGAPWAGGGQAQREFSQLHDDVTALCRTLGDEL